MALHWLSYQQFHTKISGFLNTLSSLAFLFPWPYGKQSGTINYLSENNLIINTILCEWAENHVLCLPKSFHFCLMFVLWTKHSYRYTAWHNWPWQKRTTAATVFQNQQPVRFSKDRQGVKRASPLHLLKFFTDGSLVKLGRKRWNPN